MMLSTVLCLVYLMETKHLRIGQRIRIVAEGREFTRNGKVVSIR